MLVVISAVVLGCIIGVVVGRHSVKKAQSQYKPLLTGKERIIYAALLVAGAVCLVVGLLYKPASSGNMIDDGMMMGYEEGFGVEMGDPDGVWDEDSDEAAVYTDFADGEETDAGEDLTGNEPAQPEDADAVDAADPENPDTAAMDDADDVTENDGEEVSRATGSQSGNATANTTRSGSRGGVVVVYG